MFSKKLFCLYFFFFTLFSFAQDWSPPPADPGFGGGSGDPATEPLATPIDAVFFPLLFTAMIISFLFMHKKKKSINSL
ncbi:MAG: hypothetical protein ACI9XR_002700 [Flavobacterium sp.]|jgi:hypothetical protein